VPATKIQIEANAPGCRETYTAMNPTTLPVTVDARPAAQELRVMLGSR